MSKASKITWAAIIGVAAVFIGLVIWAIQVNPRQEGIQGDKTKLVRDTSHKTGTGPVTLVEFGDFQCPYCGDAHPEIKRLLKEYDGKVTFYFRNFPLLSHENSDAAALAAESAGLQGKYWEMHDLLYENQSAWSDLADPSETFAGYAQNLGLDVIKFRQGLVDKQLETVISQDYADGLVHGVQQTPTFFINGVMYKGHPTFDEMHQKVDELLKK